MAVAPPVVGEGEGHRWSRGGGGGGGGSGYCCRGCGSSDSWRQQLPALISSAGSDSWSERLPAALISVVSAAIDGLHHPSLAWINLDPL